MGTLKVGPDFLAHFSRLDKLGGENGGLTGAAHIVTEAPAPLGSCAPHISQCATEFTKLNTCIHNVQHKYYLLLHNTHSIVNLTL